jgi:hypothetical protein
MTTEEGARAFGHVLHELEDGGLHVELSSQLRATCEQLAAHAESYGKATGSLTLTLRLSADRGGPVAIDAEVTSKTPRVSRPKTIMWLSKGFNLVPHNPRQQKLPIHEVPAPAPPRDVDASSRPGRTL